MACRALVADIDIEMVGFDGSPLRRLVSEPTGDLQSIP
jgi:hypothetical protein